MKILENKVTEIGQRDGKPTNYIDLIRDCLNDQPCSPTTGIPIGWTRSQLRDRDRIEDVIDVSKGEIRLEDEDATHLKQIVQTMRWGVRHKDILKFIDDVEGMKKYKKPKDDDESDDDDDAKASKKKKKSKSK